MRPTSLFLCKRTLLSRFYNFYGLKFLKFGLIVLYDCWPLTNQSSLDSIPFRGTVMRRWSNLNVGCRPDIELVVKGNYLIVTNHDKTVRLITPEFKAKCSAFWEKYKNKPLVGRDIILASFCPDVSKFKYLISEIAAL